MSTTTTNPKERILLAVIGDEDSVTGLLLAGIGHIDQHQKKNFLIVDGRPKYIADGRKAPMYLILCLKDSAGGKEDETQTSVIESAFQDFTERKDVAILLINQHVADKIRPAVDRYQAAFPALLEIPSKEHPYDPAKDSVLKRVQKLRGD